MDNFSKFGMMAGLGGLGAGMGGLMGGGAQNPYDDASKYFNQIPGAVSPYMDPYRQAGGQALNQLQGQYSNLVNDPTGLMNQIGRGYQQSPGFAFQMQQGMNGVNNAAASGGMSGTPANQFNAASMATGLANQDYYNYMNHGLSQYSQGLQGLSGLNQQGYNANNFMGETIGNSLMNQGNLAFSGAAAQNQAKGSQWGDIFGGLGMLAGSMFGGPMGGAAGGAAGKTVGGMF